MLCLHVCLLFFRWSSCRCFFLFLLLSVLLLYGQCLLPADESLEQGRNRSRLLTLIVNVSCHVAPLWRMSWSSLIPCSMFSGCSALHIFFASFATEFYYWILEFRRRGELPAQLSRSKVNSSVSPRQIVALKPCYMLSGFQFTILLDVINALRVWSLSHSGISFIRLSVSDGDLHDNGEGGQPQRS